MIASAARCYGYGRVSTDKQENSELAQRDAVLAHFEKLPQPLAWVDFYYDPDVSGKVPFFSRAAFRQFEPQLQHGDRIIVAKLDRAFRSLLDACLAMKALRERGVLLSIINAPFDLETTTGRFAFHVTVAAAEMEREMIGQRTLDVNAAKRSRGIPTGSKPPLGWKIIGRRGNRQFVPDDAERAVLNSLAERYDFLQSSYKLRSQLQREQFRFRDGDDVPQPKTLLAMIARCREGFPLPHEAPQHFPHEA